MCFSLVPVMVLQQLLLVLRLVLVVSSWAWDASSDTVARWGRSHWVMMSSTNRLSYKKQCCSKWNVFKILLTYGKSQVKWMNLLHIIWETYTAMHESIWSSCNRSGTIEYVALSTGYNATLKSWVWPICAVWFLLAWFLAWMTSLMRSTSSWYFLRSLMALSLASLRADSRIFTRSAVARRRFSSLGSSHLKSALSRTSYRHIEIKNIDNYIQNY